MAQSLKRWFMAQSIPKGWFILIPIKTCFDTTLWRLCHVYMETNVFIEVVPNNNEHTFFTLALS